MIEESPSPIIGTGCHSPGGILSRSFWPYFIKALIPARARHVGCREIDRTVQADACCVSELEDERDQESRHKSTISSATPRSFRSTGNLFLPIGHHSSSRPVPDIHPWCILCRIKGEAISTAFGGLFNDLLSHPLSVHFNPSSE
jgi:hypothetical protein